MNRFRRWTALGKAANFLPAATLLLGGSFLAHTILAQGPDTLPSYEPQTHVVGTIHVWGHVFFKKVMNDWEEGFRKLQPDVQFENNLVSSAAATGALFTKTAEIGVVGREIRPLEVAGYERVMKHKPLGIEVMTGAYSNPDKSIALAIFVNKDNPLTKLTFQQLDAIFGCEHLRRARQNFRVWGQLGLSGDWSTKQIQVYTGELDASPGFLFSQVVMKGSLLWNSDLRHFDDLNKPGGETYEAGQRIVDALGKDRYGIALSGAGYRNPMAKLIAISERESGPFVVPTIENVTDRSYPLSRSAWIYVNHTPNRPLDPGTKEFLRYILSREGQQAVAKEGDYLPLTNTKDREQLQKLE
jgi:phosphate transport system substrate-binding protein